MNWTYELDSLHFTVCLFFQLFKVNIFLTKIKSFVIPIEIHLIFNLFEKSL